MVNLKLSVVVVAYEMARELPRTLFSLSVSMQRNISSSEYEVIVVDNGSSIPVDADECSRWIPGIQVHRLESVGVSPVPAINKGLEMSRGEVVGVFIDGARLASPGLLKTALMAQKLGDRVVAGSLGFHLGPDVQMRSTKNGYNQAEEDRILSESGWKEDGYRLFAISVFAGASSRGWFSVPNETNALFMKRDHWLELGGYDPEFISPGGGLTNHDMWCRACDSQNSQVIMMLGEATFHQVHGGVATNAVSPMRDIFHSEYRSLRGRAYRSPTVSPVFLGNLHPLCATSVQKSVQGLDKSLARCINGKD